MLKTGVLQVSRAFVGLSFFLLSACASAGGRPPVLGDAGPDVSFVDTAIDTGPAVCNDLVCEPNKGETCVSCPTDCGQCPVCTLSPTCTGALAVPLTTEPLTMCNSGDRSNYVCGQGLGPEGDHDCLDPQLRMRVRMAYIRRGAATEDRDMYCVVIADDGQHSELLATAPRRVDGDLISVRSTTLNFTPVEGTFWGQGELYRSNNNLNISFRCYRVVDSDRTRRILGAIGTTAATVGGIAGTSGAGWVFTGVGAAANVAAAAVTDAQDRPWLDVQQTIAAEAFYDLTNGRTWTIFDNIDADVTLHIDAWGCASPRMAPLE